MPWGGAECFQLSSLSTQDPAPLQKQPHEFPVSPSGLKVAGSALLLAEHCLNKGLRLKMFTTAFSVLSKLAAFRLVAQRTS